MLLLPKDAWRSATTISGAQCVMTPGVAQTLELPADSWDCPAQVSFVMNKGGLQCMLYC